MNIKVVGTYEFILFGDGIQKVFNLRLKALKPPGYFVEGMLPIGIKEVRLKGGATLQSSLEGDTVKVTFTVPPSAATIIVDLLYGTQD